MSVSHEQPYTLPDITSFTRILAGSRCLVAAAMQISRSVIMPTTFLPATTGIAPKSPLHICIAAVVRLVSGAAALNLISHYILYFHGFWPFCRNSTRYADDMLSRSCEELSSSCSPETVNSILSTWLGNNRGNRFENYRAYKTKVYPVTAAITFVIAHHAGQAQCVRPCPNGFSLFIA